MKPRSLPIVFATVAIAIVLAFLVPGCRMETSLSDQSGERQTASLGSLVWQGELKAPPANPGKDWAYYNLIAKEAYAWNGSTWEALSADGASGLSWHGSLSSPPSSPGYRWAYYDQSLTRSLVFDGTNWLTMNPPGTSLNVSGLISDGSSLLLPHNLTTRTDLTFNAQVLKGGMIYDIDNYLDLFPADIGQHGKVMFSQRGTGEKDSVDWLSVAKNANGRILVAYRNTSSSGNGYFTILDSTGAVIVSPCLFHGTAVSCVSASALANGNFVIAYNPDSDNRGYFVRFDENGNQVGVMTQFEANYDVHNVAVAGLADATNNRFVITYSMSYPGSGGIYWSSTDGSDGTHARRATVVYNGNGSVVAGSLKVSDYAEDFFEQSVAALASGGFAVNGHVEQNGQFGIMSIFDSNYAETASLPSALESCDSTIWTANGGNVVSAIDSAVKKSGASSKFTYHDMPGGGQLLASVPLPSVDLSGKTDIDFWIRSSTNGRSAGQAKLLLDVDTTPGGIPRNGMAGEWLFNSSSTNDSSGANHNTNVGSGVGWTGDRFARGSYAENYDGTSNAYITMAGPIGIDTAASASNTVSFWFRKDYLTSASCMPFSWGGSGTNYALAFLGGGFGFTTGNGDLIGVADNFAANDWHHVVAVFYNGTPTTDSSTVKLYIDGVAQSLSTIAAGSGVSSRTVASSLRLSGWDTDGSYQFRGCLDDLRVYGHALAQAEAIQLYKERAAVSQIVDIPGFDTNSWYHFVLPLPEDCAGMVVKSIGIYDTGTFDSGSHDLWIDDIKIGNRVFEKRIQNSNPPSFASLRRADGKVAVAYTDADFAGWYKVYDPTTCLVSQSLVFSGSDLIQVSSSATMGLAQLGNGDIALAYGIQGDGYLSIYGPEGEALRSPSLFEWDTVDELSIVPLAKSRMMVFYRDNTDSGRGYFVIETDRSLRLECVDSGNARIVNDTGEQLFLMLSVNQ